MWVLKIGGLIMAVGILTGCVFNRAPLSAEDREVFSRLKVTVNSNIVNKSQLIITRDNKMMASVLFKSGKVPVIIIHGVMYKFLRNKDELALLLAHEIAHITLGHFRLSDPDTMERDADIEAVRIAHRAGFDCREGLKRKLRLANIIGNFSVRNEYGVFYHGELDRYNYMLRECERLDNE